MDIFNILKNWAVEDYDQFSNLVKRRFNEVKFMMSEFAQDSKKELETLVLNNNNITGKDNWLLYRIVCYGPKEIKISFIKPDQQMILVIKLIITRSSIEYSFSLLSYTKILKEIDLIPSPSWKSYLSYFDQHIWKATYIKKIKFGRTESIKNTFNYPIPESLINCIMKLYSYFYRNVSSEEGFKKINFKLVSNPDYNKNPEQLIFIVRKSIRNLPIQVGGLTEPLEPENINKIGRPMESYPIKNPLIERISTV